LWSDFRFASTENCLATIHVIQRGSTGVEKSLAGYLRAWRWVAENLNNNCRSFSLIIDGIWLQATTRSICITGGMRNFSYWY
jgi:hypothetical protein